MAHLQTSDEVDEETLNALLLHLDASGSTTAAPETGGTSAGSVVAADQPGDTQVSDSSTAANTAQGSQHHSAAVGASATATATGKSDAAGADIPDYALPDAQYVERTMLPLLLRGLEEVALTRPPDPLAFLGAYLISNNPQKPAVPWSSASAAAAVPGTSSNGSLTPDGAARSTPTLTPQQQQQQQPSSPFRPTDQPALADAVMRAVERFAPSAKAETA
jgi:hypothetical protein